MARRRPDPARLASLISRPGIDPRVHLTLAYVEAVRVDPDYGVLADIIMLPAEEPETAIVGTTYAGNGFGQYCPIKEDDIVLVAVPDGDFDAGPVIIARMWNEQDKPPAEIKGEPNSEDSGMYDQAKKVFLRAEPGTEFSVVVSEGATINLTVEGSGNLNITTASGNVSVKTDSGNINLAPGSAGVTNLGAESHGILDGVVHGSGIDPFTGTTYTALTNTSQKVFARKS